MDTRPAGSDHRLRWSAVALLVLTAALTTFVTAVSYGFAVEYADTAASDAALAGRSLRDWGIGVGLVLALAAWTLAAARRSRGRRILAVLAGVAVAGVLVGVPAGAVLGAHEKFQRYPELPSCTDEFTGGPAVPVVRAAQASFTELDHPGPFSGGGSSGVDGCSSQLMLDGDVDVAARYRRTLTEHGWRITAYDAGRVTAQKDGQAFDASAGQDGAWWVWIGPAGAARTTR